MKNIHHGDARNGSQVGSGWDVEFRRIGPNEALVNIMRPDESEDYLCYWPVEPDEDLQALAVKVGNCPSAYWDRVSLVELCEENWAELARAWSGGTAEEATRCQAPIPR